MASDKRSEREQLPGWVWMLFGLGIGLSVALFVYLESNELRVSDSLRDLTTRMRPADSEQEPEADALQQEPAVAEDASGDSDAEPDDPALSFYYSLPDSEVVVSDSGPGNVPELREAETLELQAGAFSTMQDADTRTAELAMLGITSRIDPQVVDDTMHYRVLIGPLSGRDEIDRIAQRLDRERIEFFPRRVSSLE